jgi:DNA (cytosine-5)-methyltransferase 1
MGEKVAVIELFAGAGGLGLGAKSAGGDVRLSVELDAVACETLRRSGHHGEVVEGDVRDLDGAELRRRAGVSLRERLVVTGGPPCQAFSKAAYWVDPGEESRYRRAREKGKPIPRPAAPPVREDARRNLVQEYFRLVAESGADGFVFENVTSILHPRNKPILERLLASAAKEGFETTLVRANAATFGVPQRRERVFVLGSRRSVPVAPSPTHSERGGPGTKKFVTAGQALDGLCSEFEPEEIVSGRWAEHLRTVPPGWNYKAHTGWAGHPNPSFVTETRFWNFLLKLSPDMPSWTIPANPGPWIGPFHWESRRLRTAELAVLQGFPHDYRFAGSRRERVRQIGNAAPPPLVAAMVRSVFAAVENRRRKARTNRQDSTNRAT